MSRKYIPYLVTLVLIAVLVGVFAHKGPQTGPQGNAPQGNAPVQDKTFDMESFFLVFDTNHDGGVLPAEFEAVYATWEQGARFSMGAGQEALSAAKAFQYFDQDRNGRIDGYDPRMKDAWDKAWEVFTRDCAKRGLAPKEWRGLWLGLNTAQLGTMNHEIGARARGELPFGGAFFDAKYFEGNRYVKVTRKDGTFVQGFATENEGKLWVVTTEQSLVVVKLADATVEEKPDSPQAEYLKAVRMTPFEDVAGNLKLARRCMELGLAREAGMMFARVLVFERENSEALKALRLKLDGVNFVPAGD